MGSKHLLGAAAAACIFFVPGAAWAQGGDANAAATDVNAGTTATATPESAATTGNIATDNLAAPAAPAAAAPADTVTPPPAPMYKVDHGFPWGILGVIGLIGLLPLLRRRDS